MLFDHGVPAPLRWSLGDHSVDLAKDYGWDTYQNGELLDAVEAECYEVFITTDKSLRHQQNLAVRKLAFIIVTPDWRHVQKQIDAIRSAIDVSQPGDYVEILDEDQNIVKSNPDTDWLKPS